MMKKLSDWEINYRLAVLRHAGVTPERLVNIHIPAVEINSYGSDGWDSGCDTCGSSESSISVDVRWVEDGKQKYVSWDTQFEVAELIRSFDNA